MSAAYKIAYCITERNGKSYWNRIGVAFVNRDGSINVKLDSLPVSGEMQLRDYVAREDRETPSQEQSNARTSDDDIPF